MDNEFYEIFYKKYLKVKQIYDGYCGYGYKLKKDGELVYDEINYDPIKKEMSCFGFSIKVLPGMKLRDVSEDLFELLLDNGYENEHCMC